MNRVVHGDAKRHRKDDARGHFQVHVHQHHHGRNHDQGEEVGDEAEHDQGSTPEEQACNDGHGHQGQSQSAHHVRGQRRVVDIDQMRRSRHLARASRRHVLYAPRVQILVFDLNRLRPVVFHLAKHTHTLAVLSDKHVPLSRALHQTEDFPEDAVVLWNGVVRLPIAHVSAVRHANRRRRTHQGTYAVVGFQVLFQSIQGLK